MVVVRKLGRAVNTARVAAAEFDPDLSNYVSSVSLIVMRPPDQISKRYFLSNQ